MRRGITQSNRLTEAYIFLYFCADTICIIPVGSHHKLYYKQGIQEIAGCWLFSLDNGSMCIFSDAENWGDSVYL